MKGGLKAMTHAKLKIASAALAATLAGGLAACHAPQPPAGRTQTAPESEFPWKSFESLHALVKPQPDEWKWARVPWMADLNEARKKAVSEGKPLYVWTMAGEPLGHN